VQAPTLVRCRREAPGEEILFVFAEAFDPPDLCQHPGDFFFHSPKLQLGGESVEGEKCREPMRLFAWAGPIAE
jgi:hypothetical protein